MRLIFFSFVIFLVPFVLPSYVSAQLTAPGSNFSDSLSYTTYKGHDPFFVYNLPLDNVPVKGTLRAVAPDSSGLWNFQWSKYVADTNAFQNISTTTNDTVSVVSGLEEGGYQVILSNGVDSNLVYRGWIYMNRKPIVTVEKDADGTIGDFKKACTFILLSATVDMDTFYYYDLISSEKLVYNDQLKIKWTSSDEETIISNATKKLNTRVNNPPPRDTRFFLTVSSFGLSSSDNVLYESTVTKAAFTIETKGYGKDDFSAELKGAAPLIARFTNTSENGAWFEWSFIDSAVYAREPRQLITTDSTFSPEFTYYVPHNYFVKLVSKSAYGCIDTIQSTEPIVVEPSLLEMPNVFTPNGDDKNDFFRPHDQSLRSYTMDIFDRWGVKVCHYEYTEPGHADWPGWDGKVHGKRDAPVGIYYYTVKASGWDDKNYKVPDNLYKGFFYLFR